jgi:hypothetical protein
MTKIWWQSIWSRARCWNNLKITLRSSRSKLSKRLSSTEKEFSFSCWFIFWKNVFSFVWQVILWIIGTTSWSKWPWLYESFRSCRIENFSFWVFMMTQMIFSSLIKSVLIYIFTGARVYFYCSLGENWI